VLQSATATAPAPVAIGRVDAATQVKAAPSTVSDLHRSPPVTLRAVRERHPWLAPVALALFALLAMAAAMHDGANLVWDGPITHAAVSLRSPGIDRVALWVSRLGSTPVVLLAGAAGVLLAARRCRSVALVMLVTVAARPLVEWLIKDVVARPRPSGARLVIGAGFSYPCGHVLAAAATWGFVPVIAGLYVHRRWLWWTLTGLAGSAIALVAWSRVWLGVHWTSDVVGSLALAFIALGIAEWVIYRRAHALADAPSSETDSAEADSADSAESRRSRARNARRCSALTAPGVLPSATATSSIDSWPISRSSITSR
jgi:undecaprenyl-diphosphatase